jgi:hypothetical protein
VTALPNLSYITGWRAGFRLDVSAWIDPVAPAGGGAFVTGRTPGELRVTGPGLRPVGVRFALPSAPAFLLWHDGWAVGAPGRAPTALLRVCAPGVLVAEGLLAPPELFDPEGDAQGDGHAVEAGAGRLVRLGHPGRPDRWVLVLGEADPETLTDPGKAWLDDDLSAWFRQGRERRAALENLPGGEETPAALTAFEVLAGALRPPLAGLEQRWSADAEENFAVHDLPLLVEAWQVWDAAVAGELLASARQCVGADGFLPSTWSPSRGETSPIPAWPGLARATARFAESHPEAFDGEPLRRNLEWWLARSDPRRRGVPTWPSAEASLTPELWEEDLGSAGLAALLLHEVVALSALHTRQLVPMEDYRWLRLEQERLPDLLENWFYQAANGRFQDRTVGADPVKRLSLGGLLAAGAPGIAEEHRRRHLRDWDGPESLLGRAGIRSWQAWPEDPEPPPVRTSLQWMALRALDADPDPTRPLRALRVVRNALLARARAGEGLGDRLDRPGPSTAWPPAAAALLLHTVQRCAGTTDVRPLSPLLRWAEKNRRRIGVAVVGGLILCSLALVLAAVLRRDTSHARQVTLAGLAKNKYALGDHAEAITLYEDLLREFPGSDLTGDYHQMLGNCYFHLGDWPRAEAMYREAMRLRPSFPQPYWNLAQTLHRQGRLEEALEMLIRIEREFGTKYPAFRRRVEDARTVMELGRSTPSRPPTGAP